MGLFGNGSVDPYTSQEQAQAAADYTDHAGGWHEPDPPNLGRDFDPGHRRRLHQQPALVAPLPPCGRRQPCPTSTSVTARRWSASKRS